MLALAEWLRRRVVTLPREFDSLRSTQERSAGSNRRSAICVGASLVGLCWRRSEAYAECRKPIAESLVGGRLVESRQSLKLTSGVRFAPSQPQPGRSAAGRCSLTADVDGSSPSPAARF